MNIIKKYTGKSLWLAGLMLTTLMAGCSGGGGGSSSTAPTVVETAPADTAETVPLNARVVATFSEAMDADTIIATSFTVIGAGGEAALVAASITYDAASKTATFTPDRNFTANKLYTATLTTAVQSALGISLATDYVWSFTSGTTADTDTSAPVVNSTDPANTETGVVLNRSVTANFSEALDPASIKPAVFTLRVFADSTPVLGNVSYSSKVLTFNPDSNLTANTEYEATLTKAITDIAVPANPLAANVVWRFTTGTNVAAGPAPVNLRTAGDFVILTKTGITNVPTSDIKGNIGASPITAAAMDNVFCPEITGSIYGVDAAYTGNGTVTCFKGTAVDKTLVDNAVLDMGTAYTDAAGRAIPDFTELYAGNISGQTLVPGLYKWGTNVWINTDVTLSGSASDVWIFQISQDVIQASDTKVHLAGGALAKNIFWQVGGGSSVDIGTGAHFEGVVLAQKAIRLYTGATVNGRLLAQTAVTLQSNAVTQPAL
jgi:hypothetical protein